uniref:Tapeworm specific antigen B n=1 Tax=Echinococcus granulosus TaxID=6210 RepID=A0A068X2H4_ECHGR|nr:Tapeworm specific antigen B [Echinococcus granulosus]
MKYKSCTALYVSIQYAGCDDDEVTKTKKGVRRPSAGTRTFFRRDPLAKNWLK